MTTTMMIMHSVIRTMMKARGPTWSSAVLVGMLLSRGSHRSEFTSFQGVPNKERLNLHRPEIPKPLKSLTNVRPVNIYPDRNQSPLYTILLLRSFRYCRAAPLSTGRPIVYVIFCKRVYWMNIALLFLVFVVCLCLATWLQGKERI